MNDNTILIAIQDFIKTEVVAGVKLQKPPTEDNLDIEYVTPYVCPGYLPPKNFLPEGYDIPGIIVGFDEGEDGYDEANLQIKLTFITYGAGSNTEDGLLVPDMNGYMDLLNLIHKTRMKLGSNPIIKGITVINKPIKWGMYQEQPWPYWYGWLTCEASSLAHNMVNNQTEQYL